jgi:hypothetical protein
LTDEFDDLCQDSVGPDASGGVAEGAGLVDGGADHGVAGGLGGGYGFTGHHRLIDRRTPFQDGAVDGQLLSGPDDDDVADQDVADVDIGFVAVADDACRPGLQADQAADGFSGAGFRSRLKQPAEDDQRDDDADGLEVQLADIGREQGREDGHHHAVAVGGDRAQGDQGVHLSGAVGQCQPAGAVDRPPRVGKHRSDQSQLQPTVQQHLGDPSGAEDVRRHHREQHRRRQDGAQGQAPPQVSHLGCSVGGFGVLHLQGRLTWAVMATGMAGGYGGAPGPGIGRSGDGGRSGRRGGQYLDAAVHHVHAAGEAEFTGVGGQELHPRRGVGR